MKNLPRILVIFHISAIFLILIPLLGDCGRQSREPSFESGVRLGGSGEGKSGLSYTGRESCRECHRGEYELFLGSDHDMAMDTATEETVLGDFDNRVFEHLGIRTRFFRQDGRFMVHTQGSGGEWQDYTVAYVFGIRPLQQYLVEFPAGAFQMLPYCWDTRPAGEGGQQWFHIYDGEKIPPEDILYWTHITQNWNYMCSECHSTNVRKNFSFTGESYNTTWSGIDVSCEACHGPGSNHVKWAREVERGGSPEAFPDMGLAIRLKDADNATWVFDTGSGTARRSVSRRDRKLIEMCARCHARRGIISEDYVFGKSLLDTHIPSLLGDGLYFADGQILEEVYVYASFLQSKMYQKGVVCTDCHEPHSGKVFASNNALCYRCHLAEKYGSRAHHFHDPEKEGSSCLECHMPERTYMVVDPRRDHSIRIPRPDLSDKLKSPNACNKCHSDKSNRWAADWCRKWYGDPGRKGKHYGEVFWAGRRSYPEALPELTGLAGNPESGPMVRATAISLLQNYQDPSVIPVLREGLADPDPLIRYAAVSAMNASDDNTLLELAVPMLTDSVRLVRTMAASQLARVPDRYFDRTGLRQREKSIREYISTQMINADHPSSHLNLGNLALNRGDYAAAEASFRKAIEIEPAFTTAYINLADLYRMLNRDRDGEQVLRNALKRDPDLAAVNYALGLNLVRRGNQDEAMNYLERATRLEPGNARYAYVYGVGLHSAGKGPESINFLESALERNPYDRDLLYALATFNQELGNRRHAIEYAGKLVEYYPEDEAYRQLIRYLRSSPR